VLAPFEIDAMRSTIGFSDLLGQPVTGEQEGTPKYDCV